MICSCNQKRAKTLFLNGEMQILLLQTKFCESELREMRTRLKTFFFFLTIQ